MKFSRIFALIVSTSLLFSLPNHAAQPKSATYELPSVWSVISPYKGLCAFIGAAIAISSYALYKSYSKTIIKFENYDQEKDANFIESLGVTIEVYNRKKHEAGCASLHKKVFGYDTFKAITKMKKSEAKRFIKVARKDAQILGYVMYDEEGYLNFIAVDPQYKRKKLEKSY